MCRIRNNDCSPTPPALGTTPFIPKKILQRVLSPSRSGEPSSTGDREIMVSRAGMTQRRKIHTTSSLLNPIVSRNTLLETKDCSTNALGSFAGRGMRQRGLKVGMVYTTL
uniref:Uncharacterized protein n=1 Tax=Compsopogon caeruleus TaxID=31354 RepID=A0A7S1THB3_9RHOD|mmetsp:Transcript_6282/g.12467  ORF Transcript_6282/g.12467 Transcript_6282/m.12467 type:complete len:110 (+) Transcript_6282:823-1152(+)